MVTDVSKFLNRKLFVNRTWQPDGAPPPPAVPNRIRCNRKYDPDRDIPARSKIAGNSLDFPIAEAHRVLAAPAADFSGAVRSGCLGRRTPFLGFAQRTLGGRREFAECPAWCILFHSFGGFVVGTVHIAAHSILPDRYRARSHRVNRLDNTVRKAERNTGRICRLLNRDIHDSDRQ